MLPPEGGHRKGVYSSLNLPPLSFCPNRPAAQPLAPGPPPGTSAISPAATEDILQCFLCVFLRFHLNFSSRLL